MHDVRGRGDVSGTFSGSVDQEVTVKRQVLTQSIAGDGCFEPIISHHLGKNDKFRKSLQQRWTVGAYILNHRGEFVQL